MQRKNKRKNKRKYYIPLTIRNGKIHFIAESMTFFGFYPWDTNTQFNVFSKENILKFINGRYVQKPDKNTIIIRLSRKDCPIKIIKNSYSRGRGQVDIFFNDEFSKRLEKIGLNLEILRRSNE